MLWFAPVIAFTQSSTVMPSELPPTPISSWDVRSGDSLIVDTKMNEGYLVHQDGGYLAFPVVTGQRRVVRYIGRTYNAATPTGSWSTLSKETKGDHITFGRNGTFFRLFRDKDDETAYGIHSHAYADTMLAKEERFRSMGCIIVSEQILEVIGLTFELSGQKMAVVTTFGIPQASVTYPALQQMIATISQKDL